MDAPSEKPRTGWLPTGLPLVVSIFVCALLIALGQFIAHARIDERDGYLFACFGRDWLRGAGLYADLWDIKPPGIFWVNALGLWAGGGSLVGVYVVCGLALAVSIFTIAWISRRRYGAATALIAALLAAVYLPSYEFHVGGNRPCTFLVLTDLLAFACYLRAWRPGRALAGWLIVSGFFGGLSFCFKQTAVAAWLALALHAFVVSRRAEGGWKRGGQRVACMLTGWLLAAGLAALGIAVRGDLGWAWDAIFAAPVGSVGVSLCGCVRSAVNWMPGYASAVSLPLLLASAVGIHAVVSRKNAADPRLPSDHPPRYVALLWLWLALALGLGTIGVTNRPWYLAAALPPLLLLAAHAVYLLVTFCTCVPAPQSRFPLILAAVWFAVMMAGPLKRQVDMAFRQYYHRFEEAPSATTTALTQAIVDYTQPDDAVFLHGYEPEVYWRTGRRMACRYLGTLAAGGWSDAQNPVLPRIATDLRADPPPLVYWPLTDDPDPKAEDFATWLTTHYHEVPRDGLGGVWVRNADK